MELLTLFVYLKCPYYMQKKVNEDYKRNGTTHQIKSLFKKPIVVVYLRILIMYYSYY